MVYHRIVNIGPCAMQWDPVVYPSFCKINWLINLAASGPSRSPGDLLCCTRDFSLGRVRSPSCGTQASLGCGAWTPEKEGSAVAVRSFSCHAACGILSSLTRDQTHVPCVGRRILNHWTSREVLSISYITVGICEPHPPSPSLPDPPPWQPPSSSPCLWVCLSFIDKSICIVY